MKEEIKFKLGDRVYAPFHGYGVVTEIKDDEQEYPIVVTWEEKQHGCISIFTPEGFAVKGLNSEDDDLTLVEKASLKGEKEMEECIKLKVGDRVSYPDKGYGIVTAIHAGTAYPIEVTWDKSLKGHEVNTFTKDGFLVISLGDCGDNDKLTVVDKAKGETEMGQIASVAESNIAKKEQEDNEKMGADDEKFQVGDRVYAPFHKYGTVVEIDGTDKSYPITVKWDESRYKIGIDLSTFTEDGYLFFGDKTENTKITKIEGEKMGQISGVIDHNIAKKMTEDSEKVSTDNEIFHVDDRVHTLFNGYGTIIGTHGADRDYPILVKWDIDTNNLTEEVSTYTVDGEYYARNHDPASALTVVKDESTIERMEDALSKKVEDAVNPAHYKVEGLPEAYDIMTHLMNREQLEGFLWGNIIKYAYRYGRKGDEADTAGKIKWYAQKLKELGECESE